MVVYKKLDAFLSDTEDLLDNKILTEEQLITIFKEALKHYFICNLVKGILNPKS